MNAPAVFLGDKTQIIKQSNHKSNERVVRKTFQKRFSTLSKTRLHTCKNTIDSEDLWSFAMKHAKHISDSDVVDITDTFWHVFISEEPSESSDTSHEMSERHGDFAAFVFSPGWARHPEKENAMCEGTFNPSKRISATCLVKT